MRLSINPTRMELIRLRRRLTFALRGHKLLKDKQEQLMREFLLTLSETKELRERVEHKLSLIYKTFLQARIEMTKEDIESAISLSKVNLNVELLLTPKMNLRVPKIIIKEFKLDSNYGYTNTTGNLDLAFYHFSEVIPLILLLAEKEKTLELLSFELEKTRRRVNALEYVLIPSIRETIKFISEKLSETERDTRIRLMKIKQIVKE